MPIGVDFRTGVVAILLAGPIKGAWGWWISRPESSWSFRANSREVPGAMLPAWLAIRPEARPHRIR
jgi:hypothetical protein